MNSNISVASDWPFSGLENVPVCPLCGASETTPAHQDLRDYFFESASGAWSLYQCSQCQSGYLNPRPNRETIGLAYSRYYTHQSYSTSSSRLRWVWRALRDDYLHTVYGVKSENTLWLGRWLLRVFPIGRQGIDSCMARHLGRLPVPGACLLDIGCGNGSFLEFAKRAGWQVRGLDLDPMAVAAARAQGLDVLEGTIDLLDDESACYDRITLSHVLEHVFDPKDLLVRCHRLLKPGGVLWLETPNMQSTGRTVFGPYWRGLEPPRHLFLFSRKCLIDMLSSLGFADVQDRFSSFSTAAMWRESKVIMTKAGAVRLLRHSLFGQLLAEIGALFSKDSREFITLVCTKNNEKK